MNIYNTFVRFFDSDDNGDEIPGQSEYYSLSDLAYIGPPRNNKGEYKDFDQRLFALTREGDYIPLEDVVKI